MTVWDVFLREKKCGITINNISRHPASIYYLNWYIHWASLNVQRVDKSPTEITHLMPVCSWSALGWTYVLGSPSTERERLSVGGGADRAWGPTITKPLCANTEGPVERLGHGTDSLPDLQLAAALFFFSVQQTGYNGFHMWRGPK